MNFESKTVHQSKALEGVSFTVKKLTEGRRLKLRMELAAANAKIRDLVIEESSTVGKPEAERAASLTRISIDTRDIINDQITPVWVRNMLESISGLSIDGEPATVETLISDGPRELYREIVSVVEAEMGLTERERGESAPPTTSSAPADGRMSDTSAIPAGA